MPVVSESWKCLVATDDSGLRKGRTRGTNVTLYWLCRSMGYVHCLLYQLASIVNRISLIVIVIVISSWISHGSSRDEAISRDIYTATRGCGSGVGGAVLDECFQEPRDSEVVRATWASGVQSSARFGHGCSVPTRRELEKVPYCSR